MNWSQFKKELDAFAENLLANISTPPEPNPLAESIYTKHKMLIGESMPDDFIPDVLFIDSGTLPSAEPFSYVLPIPEGYIYKDIEYSFAELTTALTATAASGELTIAADTANDLRFVAKFELSHIETTISAPEVLQGSFVDNSEYLTLSFSQLMKEDSELLDPDNYTLLKNGSAEVISEISTGINTSILSIVPANSIVAGDEFVLSISGNITNLYGVALGNVTGIVFMNLIPESMPSIDELTAEFFDHANALGVYGEINTKGLTATVKILYGINGLYDREVLLDPITDGSTTNTRTGFIPKFRPGQVNWKMVATLSNNTVIEAIGTPVIFYPGTKNTRKSFTLTTITGGLTYYIDPSALVNGTGTENSPFNALPASLGNSNMYLIKKGTKITYTGYGSRIGTVGTCFIGSYGASGDRPELLWDVSGDSSTRFIDATNATVVLSGLKIKSNDIFGIATYFANSPDSCVYDCEIDGFAWAVYTESHVFSPYALQWSGMNIWSCELHGQGLDTINARNVTQLKIEFVHTYDTNMMFWYNSPLNQDEDDSPGDSVQINSGCRNPLDPTGDKVPQVTLINSCTFDRSSTGNKFCIVTYSYTSEFTITNNHFIGQRNIIDHGLSAMYLNMAVQTDDNIIRDNLFENFGTAFVAHTNGIFAYNKIINCGSGVYIDPNRTQKIYNNVFKDISSYAVNKMKLASADVRNNVFVSCPYPLQFLSGGTNVNTNNHSWNSPETGTDSSTGDPLFVLDTAYDFRPATGSSLVDSGVDVGLTKDLAGVTIDAVFHKGLYLTEVD